MDKEWEKVSAEELLGEVEEERRRVPNGNARKSKKKAKTSAQNRFAEIKVKMVMRIYGVSSVRAQEIIAGRAGEKQEIERARAKAQAGGKSIVEEPPEFMSLLD